MYTVGETRARKERRLCPDATRRIRRRISECPNIDMSMDLVFFFVGASRNTARAPQGDTAVLPPIKLSTVAEYGAKFSAILPLVKMRPSDLSRNHH